MVQKFYDSESSVLREFKPLIPGKVSLYYCGATVQGDPHLGHIRSALVYDQIVRWLCFQGFGVTVIRNVTDIDDKILTNAAENNEPWWALAYRNERKFSRIYQALDILPPTCEPRATGHIPEMVQLIQKLIDRGHAYAAQDSSGDVYFEVASFQDYGGLTHQKIEDMHEEASVDRAETFRKRNPYDFALWKGAKPDEPASASWPSPWGAGRPGWHLECSAMSEKYLGSAFDIHGGGLDLRFPHHENERAQSKASGAPFANFWLHNGLLTYQGGKMSKSIGNVINPANMLKEYSPLIVRYYLGSAHYRSVLDYHPGALKEAAAAVERIELAMVRADSLLSHHLGAEAVPDQDAVPEAFREALELDMNVPAALAVIHSHIRQVNVLLENAGARPEEIGNDTVEEIKQAYEFLTGMLNVLAINPLSARWNNYNSSDVRAANNLLSKNTERIDDLLVMRNKARQAKDWKKADHYREILTQWGISLKDNPDGSTSWK